MALLSQADLTTTGGGLFGQRRAYASPPAASYFGPNGYNWYLSTLPFVTRIDSLTVAVTFDQSRVYWFYQYGSSYEPQYPWLNVTLTEDTSAQLFTFTDTSGGLLQVTVLNSLAASVAPGGFVSYTDGSGIQAAVTSRGGSQINEVQRSYTINGSLTVDSLLYSYFTAGMAGGLLQSVTWRQQIAGGVWTPLRRALYGYYGASDPNGSINDLQSAAQQLPCSTGCWTTTAVDYYRYWLTGNPTGFAHALKMHIGPENYRQLFNAGVDLPGVSDATLLPWADEYFEYNPVGGQVTREIAAVCASCPGGGTTSDLFAYATNPRSPAPDFNVWSNKTIQTLPDGSQIVVYTNYVGLPMLMVNVDPTGVNMWGTFYRFNSAGQVIWKAHPSAVALPASLATLEAYDDLLNYNSGCHKSVYGLHV